MKSTNSVYKGFWFVLAIPVINAVAANTANYFGTEIYNSGTLRGLILTIFYLYFVATMFPRNLSSRIIILSILYLLILIPLSSQPATSLIGLAKYTMAVLMFPVGYVFFSSLPRYKLLILSLFISLILYLIFIVISNFLNLGKYDYAAGTFYFGSGSVNITKDIFVLVLLAPITLLFFSKYRSIISLLYLAGFIVAVIGIKRSVLLSAIFGVAVYIYQTRFREQHIRILVAGAIITSILLVTMPSIYNTFQTRLTAREDQLTLEEEKIVKETRYNETELVLTNWQEQSVWFKLFGSEPFNDRFYYRSIRMLHTDYMVILNGTGAVGLIFWFLTFYTIFREKRKYKRIIFSNRLFIEINAIFAVMLVSQLLMSISSTVYAISLRGYIFLFWGASLGLFRSYFIESLRSDYLKVSG